MIYDKAPVEPLDIDLVGFANYGFLLCNLLSFLFNFYPKKEFI